MYRLPLFDTRVLDLGDGLNALAGRLLGDLGAEVIKVEPHTGDSLRGTPAFESLNVNKYGCVIPLTESWSGDVLSRLAALSDIVIAESGGAALATLTEVHPGLIAIHLPEEQDVTNGIAAVGAVGLALWNRRRTGRGCEVIVPAPGGRTPATGGEAIVEPVSTLRGELPIESPPWRLSETPLHIRLPAPALGEHNAYVFGQLLGLPEEEIARLSAPDEARRG